MCRPKYLAWFPFVADRKRLLNYETPATKGDNFRDNIEIIHEENVSAGVYTIQISHKGNLQSGLQDFSLIVNGMATASSSVSAALHSTSNITVYPNPIEDILKIDIESEPIEILKIDVLDLTGQLQMQALYTYARTVELEMSKLTPGIYFLTIRNEHNVMIGHKKINVH